MIKLQIYAPDIDEQIAKLDQFDAIAGRHIRQAQMVSLRIVKPAWQRVAPTLSGDYQESISSRVRRVVGLRSRGAVFATANRGGFPYPRALELASKIRKSVNPHRGKAASALESVSGSVSSAFHRATERIVKDLEVK